MTITKSKQIISLALLLGFITLAHASLSLAAVDDEARAPELPAGCEQLAAPEGYKVSSHVYAVGVQIYRWNGSTWAFIGPEANLYASPNFRGHVGTHYSGPRWESNSGSIIAATAASAIPCTPDPTAIPWLRLTAESSVGPGIYEGVKYVQRINTNGGIRPTVPGTVVGQEARIPYTTEYYFYKEQD
jgi:hypothetical protein